MIRLQHFALALLAALAIPASAAFADSGDPVVDAFKSLCLGAPNDYPSVVKAATAAGWTETELVPETDDAISITDKAAREKTVNGVHLTLLVSRGLRHTKAGDIAEADCKVSSEKPDPGVVDKTKTWLGFAPDGGDATLAVFYVKSGGGSPAHLDGAPASLNAALASGGFSVIKAQQDATSSILVYTSFSK
jgi:hypothetical protein